MPFAVEERQQDVAVVFDVFECPLFLVAAKQRMDWLFALQQAVYLSLYISVVSVKSIGSAV